MSKSSGPVRPICSSTPPTSSSTLSSKRKKCCRYEAFRSRLGSLRNCSRLVVRLTCSRIRTPSAPRPRSPVLTMPAPWPRHCSTASGSSQSSDRRKPTRAAVAARIPVLSAAAKPSPSSGSTRTLPYFRRSSRSSLIVDALVRGEVTTIVSTGAVWVQADTMHCRSQFLRWFRTGTTTVASYDTRRPFMTPGASSGDRGHDQRERRPYRQHGGAGFDGCREGVAKVFGVAAVARRVDVDVVGVEDQPAPHVAILSDQLLGDLERDALTVQLVGPQLVPIEHTDVRPATRTAGRATVPPRHGRRRLRAGAVRVGKRFHEDARREAPEGFAIVPDGRLVLTRLPGRRVEMIEGVAAELVTPRDQALEVGDGEPVAQMRGLVQEAHRGVVGGADTDRVEHPPALQDGRAGEVVEAKRYQGARQRERTPLRARWRRHPSSPPQGSPSHIRPDASTP